MNLISSDKASCSHFLGPLVCQGKIKIDIIDYSGNQQKQGYYRQDNDLSFVCHGKIDVKFVS